jgi:hypothetical protein
VGLEVGDWVGDLVDEGLADVLGLRVGVMVAEGLDVLEGVGVIVAD